MEVPKLFSRPGGRTALVAALLLTSGSAQSLGTGPTGIANPSQPKSICASFRNNMRDDPCTPEGAIRTLAPDGCKVSPQSRVKMEQIIKSVNNGAVGLGQELNNRIRREVCGMAAVTDAPQKLPDRRNRAHPVKNEL